MSSKEPRKQLPSHIDEYFTDSQLQENTHYKELFSADEKADLDLKTEINDDEIRAIATLHFNDVFLQDIGVKPIFVEFYNKFMRLKISRDRKSRSEYVEINKKSREEMMRERVSEALGIK
jgi:hypothetical protein